MKKNDFLKRQALINKLGFDLSEVSKVFSQETLNSMMMTHVVGGEPSTDSACTSNTADCTNCYSCLNYGCPVSGGTNLDACASVSASNSRM